MRDHLDRRIDTIALQPIQFLDHMCRGSSVVERRPEKAGVASSILAPGTTVTVTLEQIPHSRDEVRPSVKRG
jgi:hypothetical protein